MGLSRTVIEAVRAAFRIAGIEVNKVRRPLPPDVSQLAQALSALRSGESEELEFLRFCAHRLEHSHAQLLQDLFVLYRTGEKKNGYFVEFGAADGVALSNTCMLERGYGWRGIVAEPALCWHARLRENRRCSISTACVWKASGEKLVFNETAAGELSTIDRYSQIDGHARDREQGRRYEVETLSLDDLLASHGAPTEIDYLSIDTEGSELEILSAFDFSKYRIAIISVEHNFMPSREGMHALLAAHGYRRVFEAISFWDDWYVLD